MVVTGKTWIWIGITLLVVFLLGGVAGRFYDVGQQAKWLAEVKAAKDEADAAKVEAAAHLKVADEARKELLEVRERIAESEVEVIRIPPDLKTLKECRAAVRTLQHNRVLMKEEIKHANAESLALRDALAFKATESEQLTEALKFENKRYSALRRSKTKDKRRRIAVSVVTSVAVFGVGYGLGTIQN